MVDPDLIEVTLRAALRDGAKGAAPLSAKDTTLETEQQKPIQPLPLPSAPANMGLAPAIRAKEKKTAEELAAMILNDLRKIEGCPKSGVNVTVYGSNPWNVWLSFGSKAGPVRNKSEMHNLCDVITERLRRLYDISQ